MDNFTAELLKYFCSEYGLMYDESLVDTDEFKSYAENFAERSKKVSETKIQGFESKLVQFVTQVSDMIHDRQKVEIVVAPGQRKPLLSTLRGFMRAKYGRDWWVDRYLKVNVKKDQ